MFDFANAPVFSFLMTLLLCMPFVLGVLAVFWIREAHCGLCQCCRKKEATHRDVLCEECFAALEDWLETELANSGDREVDPETGRTI